MKTPESKAMGEFYEAAAVAQKEPAKPVGGKTWRARREGKLNSIRSLKTPEEISGKTKGRVSVERLLGLAEAGLIPHYDLEGDVYFNDTETQDWLADNLCLKVPGSPFPCNVHLTPIYVETPGMFLSLPPEIKTMATWLVPLRVDGILAAGFSGIYFLVKENTVVYVGQSTTIAKRIGAHVGEKDFDHAFCMRFDPSDLSYMEGVFMRELKPKYNRGENGRILGPRGDDAFGVTNYSVAIAKAFREKKKESDESAPGLQTQS